MSDPTPTKNPTCGIVMPISEIDGCSANHWVDVRAILTDAIFAAGFEPNLVSNADEVGIIQKRIIQNLYTNPVVVCDVSAKNPNVMFELGIRLAFDRPAIIVKDDKTAYTFDTGPIEHLRYPRDLRFGQIVEFKAILSEKIKATHEAAAKNKNYTTFLKHFGSFKVAKLETEEVSTNEFILEELKQLRAAIKRPQMSNIGQLAPGLLGVSFDFEITGTLNDLDSKNIFEVLGAAGIELSRVKHSGRRLEIASPRNQFREIIEVLNTKYPEAKIVALGGKVIE
jgi:hypothetical protein